MLLQWLLSAWHAVLEVLFPTNCLVCGRKLLEDESIACSDCVASIPRTEHAILDQNGIDMLFLELIQKQRRTVHYEHGAAFAFYNRDRGFALRTLIERGKYGTHPDPQIFYFLGRLAAQEYIDSDLFDDIDYLVPVPLHPRRRRERGFNQTEWICRGLSDVLHIPIDTEHYTENVDTPEMAQRKLPPWNSPITLPFLLRVPSGKIR